jgi:hypothetical protein
MGVICGQNAGNTTASGHGIDLCGISPSNLFFTELVVSLEDGRYQTVAHISPGLLGQPFSNLAIRISLTACDKLSKTIR